MRSQKRKSSGNPKAMNIIRLKDFAETLPRDSTLRAIIVLDSDEMSVEAFLAKLPLWLRLNRISNRG